MTYVRDVFGNVLECCWDDCFQRGVYEHRSMRFQDGSWVTYIFCSARHQEYWRHAARLGNGNLPTGSRNFLWLPRP